MLRNSLPSLGSCLLRLFSAEQRREQGGILPLPGRERVKIRQDGGKRFHQRIQQEVILRRESMAALHHRNSAEIAMIGGIYFLCQTGNVVEYLPAIPQGGAAALLQILGETEIFDEKDVLFADAAMGQAVLPEDIVDLAAEALHGDDLIGRVKKENSVLQYTGRLMDQRADAGIQRERRHQDVRHPGLG